MLHRIKTKLTENRLALMTLIALRLAHMENLRKVVDWLGRTNGVTELIKNLGFHNDRSEANFEGLGP